jgi:hypothetical protein
MKAHEFKPEIPRKTYRVKTTLEWNVVAVDERDALGLFYRQIVETPQWAMNGDFEVQEVQKYE